MKPFEEFEVVVDNGFKEFLEKHNIFKADYCSCGAWTLSMESGEVYIQERNLYVIGLSQQVFYKYRCENPDLFWNNCNHCVNHWGVDLKPDGSGEYLDGMRILSSEQFSLLEDEDDGFYGFDIVEENIKLEDEFQKMDEEYEDEYEDDADEADAFYEYYHDMFEHLQLSKNSTELKGLRKTLKQLQEIEDSLTENLLNRIDKIKDPECVKRISPKLDVFVCNTSSISLDNLSPEYYSNISQKEVLREVVTHTNVSNLEAKFKAMAQDKSVIRRSGSSSYTFRFNDESMKFINAVVEELQE